MAISRSKARVVLSVGAALLLSACGRTSAPSSGSGGATTTEPPSAVVVNISPAAAALAPGGAQVFTATVTGAGSASTSVVWSVNGIAGGNASLGAVSGSGSSSNSSTGIYTAPALPPSPAIVQVTATSAADTTKSASASVTIACANSNAISPAQVSLAPGQMQNFTAALCAASATPIAWDVNGIANGNAQLGTIAVTAPANALYSSPTAPPPGNSVTVHAIASAPGGTSQSAAAVVTFTSGVSISITPTVATLSVNERISVAADVFNASDTGVTWLVNGAPNGNTTVGQICVSGLVPCSTPPSPSPGTVDYLAPAAPPASNPVMLTAVSHADPSRSATALLTITPATSSVSVALSPQYAFLAPTTGAPSTQQFFASVTGTANTAVSWSVQSGVSGAGCAGTACGSISSAGLYSAPAIAPSPNSVSVTATSLADSTKSATATVAITSGPAIETILPSSASAGAVQSFPLAVQGTGFTAGSGGASSVILLNSVPRGTTCSSTTSCATVLNPSDIQASGSITVQIENPGSPGALSNPVPFVIEPFDPSAGVISLSASIPVAASADIVVVEPTNAASSAPINVDFVGYLTGGNTCGIQGSPLAVVRPASGASVASICVHGTALDPTFTYSFTGPGAPPGNGDIAVTASAITGALPNMIELDLQISSATLPGVRALFITTLNNDRAVATGVLEVK